MFWRTVRLLAPPETQGDRGSDDQSDRPYVKTKRSGEFRGVIYIYVHKPNGVNSKEFSDIIYKLHEN